ncbi:hypothetical protein E2320_012801 [Naja naja]|nr:hypothetical protein E2320_012801 [Naja naja]
MTETQHKGTESVALVHDKENLNQELNSKPGCINRCPMLRLQEVKAWLYSVRNNIKENATVPESPQATQQGLGVPSAVVGLAGALLGERLQGDLEGLHLLLLTRHPGQNLLENQRAQQPGFPGEQLVSVRLISSFKTFVCAHCQEHKLQALIYNERDDEWNPTLLAQKSMSPGPSPFGLVKGEGRDLISIL